VASSGVDVEVNVVVEDAYPGELHPESGFDEKAALEGAADDQVGREAQVVSCVCFVGTVSFADVKGIADFVAELGEDREESRVEALDVSDHRRIPPLMKKESRRFFEWERLTPFLKVRRDLLRDIDLRRNVSLLAASRERVSRSVYTLSRGECNSFEAVACMPQYVARAHRAHVES